MDAAELRRYMDAIDAGIILTGNVRRVDGRLVDLVVTEARKLLEYVEGLIVTYASAN